MNDPLEIREIPATIDTVRNLANYPMLIQYTEMAGGSKDHPLYGTLHVVTDGRFVGCGYNYRILATKLMIDNARG